MSGRELVLQVIDIRAVSGDVRRIVVNIPAVRRNVRRIVLNLDIGFVELGPIDRLVRRRRNGAGSYICDLMKFVKQDLSSDFLKDSYSVSHSQDRDLEYVSSAK